jgi:hypothetical protein
MGQACRYAHGADQLNQADDSSQGCQFNGARTASLATQQPNGTKCISKTIMAMAVSKAMQTMVAEGGNLSQFTSILCEELDVTRQELKDHRDVIADCLQKCGIHGQNLGGPNCANPTDVTQQLMQSSIQPRDWSQYPASAIGQQLQYPAPAIGQQTCTQGAIIPRVGKQLQAAVIDSEAKSELAERQWQMELANGKPSEAPMKVTLAQPRKQRINQDHKLAPAVPMTSQKHNSIYPRLQSIAESDEIILKGEM